MDGTLPEFTPASTLMTRSVSREHGFEPLTVEGAIPNALRGTLFRVGPGLLDSVGVPVTHLFEADGAVSAIRIGDGGAEGAIRVVQSAGLVEERAAGKALSGFRAPYHRRLLSMVTGRAPKNIANTAPMLWQDRLFAMVEAFRPTEMDANTLATIGETDLGGVVPFAFSAHPHRVASRRAQYNFGVRYGRVTKLDLFELPDVGPARRMASLSLERAVMMHDFIATDRHLVFLVSPFDVNLPRAILQIGPFGKMFEFHPEHGTEVIVVPIDAPTNPTRFRVDAFYQWHFANAFESGAGIELDFARYTDAESFHQLGTDVALGGDLVRVRIDPARRELTTTGRHVGMYEFPVVDPRVAGVRHRYVFTTAETATTRGIARHDQETGDVVRFSAPTSTWYGEPVFVPDQSGGEGDGWLLTMALDARAERSQLAIFDAREVDRGPIARLIFPECLPVSFHGLWKPNPVPAQ